MTPPAPRVAPRRPLLVVGATGQLGRAVLGAAAAAGVPARGVGRRELDLTAPVRAADVAGHAAVLNCAAHTAVDAAEADPEAAFAVNDGGVGALGAACTDAGVRLIHISTDYVFSGRTPVDADGRTRGWEPGDEPDPQTVYGASKLAGERRLAGSDAVVVRTSWVYTGPARRAAGLPGDDFVTTMLRLAAEREAVDVVADQHGSPTWAPELAAGLVRLAGRPETPAGVLHLAGAGAATWYELARTAVTLAGGDPERIRPCATVDFPRPAPRPSWSVLSSASWDAAGLGAPRHWRAALADALAGTAGSAGRLAPDGGPADATGAPDGAVDG